MASANVSDVMSAINAAAKASGFSCRTVSWEDAQRGHTASGGLSCVGPNIADVRLYEKSGTLLYTLRSENWNERLGYVNSNDVMLMTGNEEGLGVLKTVSLADYLRNASTFGSYAGLTTPSLFAAGVDELFSIRFQAVFLPTSVGFRSTTEFCTEVFSYQTRTATNPRNMLLLATPQGTSMQEDVPGRGKVFFHSHDPQTGQTPRFWLEAERSDHAVGGAQTESTADIVDAAERGKAVAVRIGPSAMGTRFNVQMLIQVPLKQTPEPVFRTGKSWFGSKVCKKSSVSFESAFAAPSQSASCRMMGQNCPSVGVSNAARVSRGTQEDQFAGLAQKAPTRDASQHGTITVTMYYTVAGGVPSVQDVQRCVADLDALYKAMPSDKRLANCTEVLAGNKSVPTNPAVPVNIFGNGASSVPPVPKPNITPNPYSSTDRGVSVLPPGSTPAGGLLAPLPHTLFARPETLLCPQGHALLPFVRQAAPYYFCDVCGRVLDKKDPSCAKECAQCDFDVCAACLARTNAPCYDSAPLVPWAKSVGAPVGQLAQCSLCGCMVTRDSGVVFVRPRDRTSGAPTLSPAVCLACYINGNPQ